MFKFFICASLFAVSLAGIVHEHHDGGDHKETEHHTHIEHDHEHKFAQSHQSVKFIHYHPVPVYVKKEDQKYLHHPVEIGSIKHNHKLVHPETEHHHGHGLVLENHSEHKNHMILHHHDSGSAGSKSHEVHAAPVEEETYEYHH